jgi:hypothetical protein
LRDFDARGWERGILANRTRKGSGAGSRPPAKLDCFGYQQPLADCRIHCRCDTLRPTFKMHPMDSNREEIC